MWDISCKVLITISKTLTWFMVIFSSFSNYLGQWLLNNQFIHCLLSELYSTNIHFCDTLLQKPYCVWCITGCKFNSWCLFVPWWLCIFSSSLACSWYVYVMCLCILKEKREKIHLVFLLLILCIFMHFIEICINVCNIRSSIPRVLWILGLRAQVFR